MFARDLRECLAAQLADRNRLDPAMQALLDNLELLARRDLQAADGAVRRGCRGPRRHDRRDQARSIRSRAPPATRRRCPLVVPDILMRAGPDGSWVIELNPRDHAARAGERAASMPASRPGRRRRSGCSSPSSCRTPTGWCDRCSSARRPSCKVAAEIVRQQDGFFRHGVGASAPADPARHRRRGGDAREHRQPRDLEQIHRDAARHLRA